MSTQTRVNSNGETVQYVGTDSEIAFLMSECKECGQVDCVCPEYHDEEEAE